MAIRVRVRNGVHVVAMAGEFTVGTRIARPLDLKGRPVDDLQEALGRLFDKGARNILLDLEGVTFIDSAGLGELLAAKKRALERSGDIKLLRPPRKVREMLSMTRLDQVFDIQDSEDKAVAGFPAGKA